MTIDGANDHAADHPHDLSDRERHTIEALRRRYEEDAPQGFTDSDASRFDRIVAALRVPRFPVTREELVERVRANHGADSVLVAIKSLPHGARYATYDELMLALGVGTAGRVDVPGVPARDPEGGAPSLPG